MTINQKDIPVDEILADEQASGTVLWPLLDQFYNVRDLVKSSSAHYNHYDYEAFGAVYSQWNNGLNLSHAYGFQSRERDLETGLNYHRNRYYNPSIGRWISEDPIGFAGGDVNLNRFVGNGPTTERDPRGLLQFNWDKDAIFQHPNLWLLGQMHVGDTIINTDVGTVKVLSGDLENLASGDQDYWTARCMLNSLGHPLPFSENGVYWADWKDRATLGLTLNWTGLGGDDLNYSFLDKRYKGSASSPRIPGNECADLLITLYHEVKGHNVDEKWHRNSAEQAFFFPKYEDPIKASVRNAKNSGTWITMYCACHKEAATKIKNYHPIDYDDYYPLPP